MMTTACATLLNRSSLRSPVDYGYSDDALGIRDKVQGIWKDFESTFTVGIRFDGMKTAIWDACREALQENWDGYGAKPCDLASLARALHFSYVMPESVRVPDVVVDPEGMIEFEWYAGPHRVFSVTIESDGSLVYAGLFGVDKTTYGRDSFEEEIPRTVFDGIQRVYSR